MRNLNATNGHNYSGVTIYTNANKPNQFRSFEFSIACTIYFGGRWEKTAYIIILSYSHNKVMRVYNFGMLKGTWHKYSP